MLRLLVCWKARDFNTLDVISAAVSLSVSGSEHLHLEKLTLLCDLVGGQLLQRCLDGLS